MPILLHHIVCTVSQNRNYNIALYYKDKTIDYYTLSKQVNAQSIALGNIGIKTQDRVGIYLTKQIETVTSLFAISKAGGIIVPINPLLKAVQVEHILQDCSVKVLITSKLRVESLRPILERCENLETIIVVDNHLPPPLILQKIITWEGFLTTKYQQRLEDFRTGNDIAAILYTSGSTGKPKGVIVSHSNLILGAQSVAQYLHITSQDRLLAVLPFSFDYGLNQLTSAFLHGASCIIHEHLLVQDLIKIIQQHKVTGFAGVPTLWTPLANLSWPKKINTHLRYITNSGGKLPLHIINKLSEQLPQTKLYLMYGLTEAFRSTYLKPEQVKTHPNSIGKAIPNAQIRIIQKNGQPCKANQAGELVHCGPLVTLGYWNNPEETAKRYKPDPLQLNSCPIKNYAVWSGDTAYFDEQGYFYFVERQDNMIKTSGYRVSPTEIEDQLYLSTWINEVIAIGLPDELLGQIIVLVVSLKKSSHITALDIQKYCQQTLANFMQPKKIVILNTLPKTANGKIDRPLLYKQLMT